MLDSTKRICASLQRPVFTGAHSRMHFSENLFTMKKDPYNGVTVNKDELPETREKFSSMLAKSIARWKEVKRFCILSCILSFFSRIE